MPLSHLLTLKYMGINAREKVEWKLGKFPQDSLWIVFHLVLISFLNSQYIWSRQMMPLNLRYQMFQNSQSLRKINEM